MATLEFLTTAFEATPNRMEAVYRIVCNYPEGIGRSDLRKLLAPSGLSKTGEATNIPDPVIRQSEVNGIIEQKDTKGPAKFTLTKQAYDHGPDFIDVIDSVIFSTPESPLPLTYIAWILSMNPYTKSGVVDQAQANGILLNGSIFPTSGTTPQKVTGFPAVLEGTGLARDAMHLQQLMYWSNYLGLISIINIAPEKTKGQDNTDDQVIMINPANLILRHLRRRNFQKEFMPLNQFMKDVSDALPVLEGGRIRGLYQSLDGTPSEHKLDANRLSPSTSLALLTLQAMKVVELEHRDDFPEPFTLSLADKRTQRYTHIKVGI